VNGNGSSEVKAVLKAAGRLASPGDTLFGIAKVADETFSRLLYADQKAAAGLLAARLENTLWGWNEVIKTFKEP